MKIIVEIASPPNVHFFKNIIRGLQGRGHEIVIAARERELTLPLLNEYGFAYRSISQAAPGHVGRLKEILVRTARLCSLARAFQPDLFFGKSYSFILAARLLRKPALLDTDDGKAAGWLNYRIMKLADIICTPRALGNQFGIKQVTYPGYKELAYLHPGNFQPDPRLPEQAGIREGERYFILRFSGYSAIHDVGKKGISLDNKLRLLNALKPLGRVFVTSEKRVDEKGFREYSLNVSPGKIHSLLFYADLYAGDSQTMATEAAVLGVPSVRCSPFAGKCLGMLELEKQYGLMINYGIEQQEIFIKKVEDLGRRPDLKGQWEAKRREMLRDNTNVAEFYLDLIDSLGRKWKR